MADKIKLKYSFGKTINAGNYESFRVDAGAEWFCENKKVDVDRTFAAMKKFVDGKVREGELECQV